MGGCFAIVVYFALLYHVVLRRDRNPAYVFIGEVMEMSVAFKQVVENIANLSPDEKALVAHCLISSLEDRSDDNVDQAWGELAHNRLAELESGEVQGVYWAEIKGKIRKRNA